MKIDKMKEWQRHIVLDLKPQVKDLTKNMNTIQREIDFYRSVVDALTKERDNLLVHTNYNLAKKVSRAIEMNCKRIENLKSAKTSLFVVRRRIENTIVSLRRNARKPTLAKLSSN